MVKVGDTVHFWQAGDAINIPVLVGKPLPAMVCEIEGSGKVTLTVFDRHGNCWPVTSVPVRESAVSLGHPDTPFFACPRL